jgi:ABC-type glycerol-3-phosphate transport system substrate-binding protein
MRMKATRLLALLSVSAALAACGGGSPDEAQPSAPNEVPASATASPAAYSQYVGSLAKTETGLPLEVNKVVPPTSETALPLPVS